MRTIKKLINKDKKVYIVLKTKEIQYRFMSDAAREGITFGDGTKTTDRMVDDIMVLQTDGTICFLGFIGRVYFHHNKKYSFSIDYEKYIDGNTDYYI